MARLEIHLDDLRKNRLSLQHGDFLPSRFPNCFFRTTGAARSAILVFPPPYDKEAGETQGLDERPGSDLRTALGDRIAITVKVGPVCRPIPKLGVPRLGVPVIDLSIVLRGVIPRFWFLVAPSAVGRSYFPWIIARVSLAECREIFARK
jgi:hypothetical protein